jgi:hypothetical protein
VASGHTQVLSQALGVQVAAEPLGCQVRHVLQCSRFLKTVRRPRDDRQVFGSGQGVISPLIEFEDGGIARPVVEASTRDI